MKSDRNHYINDFTELFYRKTLIKVKEHWQFEFYGVNNQSPHVLWRHDVDFSVHRSLRLAQIEAEEGVKSTFFFMLHSEFYNFLEAEIISKVNAIAELGHDIGLHFDAAFHAPYASKEQLEEKIDYEKKIIEYYTGAKVQAFSFHNPEVGNAISNTDDSLGGLINVYSSSIKENYHYCSDSNGYWRFERLWDFLDKKHDYMQILTHPAWWTPEPIMPFERIKRAAHGRSNKLLKEYEEFLKECGRQNVK